MNFIKQYDELCRIFQTDFYIDLHAITISMQQYIIKSNLRLLHVIFNFKMCNIFKITELKERKLNLYKVACIGNCSNIVINSGK